MGLLLNGIALAQLIAGRNEEALIVAERCIDESPRLMSGLRMKIAALIHLGQLQEAKSTADVLLTHDPAFTISSRMPTMRDCDARHRYWGALKAAGFRK